MSEKQNAVAELSTRDLSDLRALSTLARAGLEDARDAASPPPVDLAQAAGDRGARQLALATVLTMVGMIGASVGIVVYLNHGAREHGVASGPAPEVFAAPLAYTVEEKSARYLFADGTTVAPAADAAVTVDASAARHPRVRVVGGRVRVRVVHQDGRQWTFHAGPYDVRVTGTAFDLTWDAAAGRMALHMHEGAVEVRGPDLPTPARVYAGEELSASVPPHPSDAEGPPPAKQRPGHGHEAVGRGESWRVLVGRGEFGAVLEQAKARPLAACLSRCSSEDLRALGDAARYSRQPALATRALQALRRRFPTTADGTAATFLLGRNAETQKRWKDAAAWYGRYLEEAPTGEFAVGAAEGRARAAGEVTGGDGARPAARVRSPR
jgi:ferric-dicitrate binding protein FerR (iron transport regulator)